MKTDLEIAVGALEVGAGLGLAVQFDPTRVRVLMDELRRLRAIEAATKKAKAKR